MQIAFRPMLVAALALLPALASAQERISQRYDVVYLGIRAGEAAFEALLTDTRYSLAGQLRSTGLLRALVNVAYTVKAVGRVANGRLVPERYEEDERYGKRVGERVIEYSNGVPRVVRHDPPRKPQPTDVDPATQGDAVDPATAVFLALRDVPREEACRFSVTLFDGVRRSRLVIVRPEPEGDGLRCTAQYQRLAGYREWELENGGITPMTFHYRPNGSGMLEVAEVRVSTSYGTVHVKRR
ncbi:Protein of unknown function [Meinhardsimonia xiamenensis]|jgi:hypothetical protein|uniref:DUF3108 domain-containing protein n=2 Tax=Meinhardsimonia xiamenensis TaxID=990712 RepID=A0A1G8ZC99_9RHOB|nr:DUF3108 domain-containing protein [Meinhardsimonia xiamenensis]PRX37640.1 uncharacterized protein DUF3108 [Meinhardsimonia xiamenensis]SDK12573.1 Protein of unknown function [Meinhardsimonia xiamenensis]